MSDTLVEEVVTAEAFAQVRAEKAILEANMELLRENMADVILKLDDAGQRQIGGDFDEDSIPLETVKRTSKVARAQVSLNPLAKRGVAVRSAYIWGNGVEYKGLEDSPFWKSDNAQKYLLSPKAQVEMEATLATDGNFFILAEKAKGRGVAKVSRVPMKQITGNVTDPDNHEEIWFYRREWTRSKWNATLNRNDTEDMVVYYPAADHDVKASGKPRQIDGKPVDYNKAIVHHDANKQTGWHWGLPDMTAVIFWLGAHKDFLEDCKALVKAYQRFAFKATTPNARATTSVATKVAAQPSRDHMGNPQDVGATAVLGGGNNLSAMRTGSVDFKAGVPLAGYIAAGLEIPLTELLADAGEANRSSAETLDKSTLNAMKARQRSHIAFYKKLFKYLGLEVDIVFPPIEKEAVYRQIQAIASALPLNVLSAKEMRKMLIQAFEIDGADPDVLPTEEELGLMVSIAKAQAEAKVKQADTDNPSNGDNSYRDDAGQHEYTDGQNG